MKNEFNRKEVWLHDSVIERLQSLADKKKWSLKQFMETTLIRESNKLLKKQNK